jgi:hypothetical protein
LLEVREVILTRVAGSDVGDTRKAIVAAIRASGLPGNPKNFAHVQELRDNFHAARRHRGLNEANSKTAKAISSLSSPSPAARPSDCLLGRLQCV